MIKILNISCNIYNKELFNNININVSEGTCIIIKGFNGSGKSTLLNTILGIIHNFNGQLYFNNINIKKSYSWKKYLSNIHYLNVNNYMIDKMNIYKNINYFSYINGFINNNNKIINFINIWKIKNRLLNELSTGEQRKIIISILLTIPKYIWILDEPTIGFDYNNIKFLENLINLHCSYNGIVILTTHLDLNLKCAHYYIYL